MNYLLRAKKFQTKKRLGQNFLIDSATIKTIIDKANITPDETVVEIGAGAGFVTEQLAQLAEKVYAIEIDPDAIFELETLPFSNIEIIPKDILKTDISELVSKPVKIVANIPYYITSAILVHLLGEIDELNNQNKNSVKEIILMVQYEVAKRITATEKSHNKEYGILSILVNYWCETEFVCKVPAKCFYPAPKVDSAIIKLTVRDKPAVETNNTKLFRQIIKASFNLRRKTIKNSLAATGYSADIIAKALEKSNINPACRGETLSMQEFSNLANAFGELL